MTYETIKENYVDGSVEVSSPADVAEALKPYRALEQEHFLVLHLDTQNCIKAIKIATIGVLDKAIIDVREVFRDAIMENCSAIIIAHNHPGGSTKFSGEDRQITKKLIEAGDLLGIQVLDHVIVTKKSYNSLCAEKGGKL